MIPRFNVATVLVAAASYVFSVNAISKVTRTGRYLYTDDGNRFYIKGIAYQEQGVVVQDPNNPFGEPSSFFDPLADANACARDVPHLSDLGVNTIRVYSVDSTKNHDSCMQALSDAGIYTIIDLSLPLNGSIDRVNPSWSTNILNQYINTIDAFSKYDNVLGYNVANEAVLSDGTGISPYVKAAARDIRAYLNSKSSSALVGYAAIDGDPSWRNALANYLACDPSGSNSDATAIDIYGLNNYEWCGDSTFQNSYAGTTSDYENYNVVAYFSEFGCVSQPPRLWTEVEALFSSQMSNVWSGGIAFSYFPASSAAGQFGMVTVSSDGRSVSTSEDFTRLKDMYANASGPNSPSRGSVTASYPACSPPTSAFVASTTLPPTPDENACNCLQNTLSCKFTPATANYSGVLGELVGTACGLLSQRSISCEDIGGNGTTGTYGRIAGCDPSIKLSYVMSEFYEASNRDGQACSFSGNGTVNPLAPSSAAAANAAASSCISNPSSTFIPSGPSGSAGGGSSSSGSGNNGAVALVGNKNAIFGMVGVIVVGALSAVWTLA
ncbi:glycoside hydrolase family 72 protein [Moniliophthora roreri MCA 2997]|uniref:1,3-beta-glucanosyltransferase n=2 Tax=Moniliophthora roreri TaxID=221103 RepID=V2XG85_MONRO|nr:glycoside hydrolase family 72 protein [Moniliophthora roreri MCA 2997]KAI3622518.1 glycoside hydrolase family 72 protein [Moniliophthora roreri]